MSPNATKTVALIFGGVSAEHEVSCVTAGGVCRVVDTDRFAVQGVGITKDGRWVRVPVAELQGFRIADGQLPSLAPDCSYPEALLYRDGDRVRLATRDGDRLRDAVDVDVAFALLHGPFGEDGTVQGLFEMLGLRYVGAGVTASAVSMDKDLTRRALANAGVPVVPWVGVGRSEWAERPEQVLREVAELGYPVFVKPSRNGSSLGISRVAAEPELASAMESALALDPKVLVERGLVGMREIEVGVIGAPPDLRVSVPGEIGVAGTAGFYDFDAKYLGAGSVSLEVPADLPAALTARVQALAAEVFRLMQVEGLARVDFFVCGDEVIVNELNTMPGFTSESLFPRVWEATGLPYPELVAELIDLALERPLGLR
jgi:D-alanine-D-alanine ligase